MKRFFGLITVILFLAACAGMSSFDGNSTKKWITIESSKQDFEGKTIDICYRLDVRFSPQEATKRFDLDKACINRCCWYSESKQVNIDLNNGFLQELKEKGKANKYALDNLVFKIQYSNLLNTINATLEPKSAIRSDGLITLKYTTLTNEQNSLKIDLNDLHVNSSYPQEDEEISKSAYLLKEQELVMSQHQKAINELMEGANQKFNTGLLKTNSAVKTTNKNNSVYIYDTQDFNDEAQNKQLLEQQINYEKNQAIKLVKQFYAQDIDAYIHFLDKQEEQKANILLANDRTWKIKKVSSSVYRVSCIVNGKLGKTQNTMKDHQIACGTYDVDLDNNNVMPKNITAISIVNKDYKD